MRPNPGSTRVPLELPRWPRSQRGVLYIQPRLAILRGAMPKTVFITGVAGFMGSNLSRALLQRGDRVIGIDNLSIGQPRNLEGVPNPQNLEFHEADVLDGETVKRLSAPADILVHLAASKIPRYSSAMATLITNTEGTKSVLEAARVTGARAVIASTSDVYGKNPQLPFREDSDLVIGPSYVRRWSYAISKAFDEHLAFAYEDTYKLPVTVLRFFGGYGPFEHRSFWGGPQSVFIEAILSGGEIDIHGDGLQTRSFLFADDLIDGIVRAIDHDDAAGEIFNIGSTDEISILELARVVQEVSGVGGEPRIKFVPYASFTKGYEDVRRRVPDITKARTMLGFRPHVSLREGLARTFAYHKSEIAAAQMAGTSAT